MANLSKESAGRIMASRKFITQPGKYQVRVTNDVQELAAQGTVRKELAGGGTQCSIANFAAYTPYMLDQFRKLSLEGDFDSAANNNLTASVRETDHMPQKGEIVNINVDYVTTKSGEQALLVTSYTPIEVSSGAKISLDDIFGSDEEQERVEVTSKDAVASFENAE